MLVVCAVVQECTLKFTNAPPLRCFKRINCFEEQLTKLLPNSFSF